MSGHTNAYICYTVPDGKRFLWEHWDDESLLFDRYSGQTHLLTATAVEALLSLQNKPQTLRELADHIADVFELAQNTDLLEHIEELLKHFEETGLADRC